MPFTTDQLTTAGYYAIQAYRKNDPVDQVNEAHPFLDKMVSMKETDVFTAGYVVDQIHVDNGSNYQNYFGSDQVTYNERDPVRQVKYAHSNFHDGFGFDEDRLSAAGIVMDDNGDSVPSKAEQRILSNLLRQSWSALKSGIHVELEKELLRDGTQDTKATDGLDLLVDIDPTTGTVGGLDRSTATYFRNNINLSIAAANLVDEMEESWRACIRYGGEAPDCIFVGETFLDTYRQQAGQTINRQLQAGGNAKGGVSLDASVTGVFFKGIPLVWVPMFDTLQTLDAPAQSWKKRCYFINSKHLKLTAMAGNWMKERRPPRIYDRYVHYFGMTSKYALTMNKARCHAVLTVA